jgi:hypothetical protein
MYMYLRPGLLEFLEATSKYFELVLFSNGSQVYTHAVLDKLKLILAQQKRRDDPTIEDLQSSSEDLESLSVGATDYFSHVLCREQCSTNEKGHEIKNLDFFAGSPSSNREIRDCLIVDNQIYCFQNHLTNGLYVPNYNFSDTHDDWLPLLSKYLVDRFTKPEQDVRSVISKDFKYEEIIGLSRVAQIKQMMNRHQQATTAAEQQQSSGGSATSTQGSCGDTEKALSSEKAKEQGKEGGDDLKEETSF